MTTDILPDLSPGQLESVVLERMPEVLAILYKEAAGKWAEAHLKTASANADIKQTEARIFHLTTIIEHFRKREAKQATAEPL